MKLSAEHIQQKLTAAYDPAAEPESPYPPGSLSSRPQKAAVLIPLLWDADEWNLLFIRRTNQQNDRHGGQVAFPGGRCEPTDGSAENAALREAYEEVGLKPEDVQILGKVRDILTISNYRVTPVVANIPWPYYVKAQIDEVSRIFTIPLKWLAAPQNRIIRRRNISTFKIPIPVIYFNDFDGEILWGASARMMMLLLEALGWSAPQDRYSYSNVPTNSTASI
jgi:8-oxo-dGTP pyrophosphatase MutT (NUDIX family)